MQRTQIAALILLALTACAGEVDCNAVAEEAGRKAVQRYIDCLEENPDHFEQAFGPCMGEGVAARLSTDLEGPNLELTGPGQAAWGQCMVDNP